MKYRCSCIALRRGAAIGTAHYDAALAPSGVKIKMYRLLRRIDEANDISISELAVIVGLDRSTLGRNLRVLEKQSQIKMSVGQDERAWLVTLTAKGRATLQAALPLWRSAQTEFARIIGPETMALLDRFASLNTKST